MALPKVNPLPTPQGFTTEKGGLSTAGYGFLQSLYQGCVAALSQVSEAAAGDYQGNAPGFLALTPETVWAAATAVSLTDATSITVDMATGFNFAVTIAGNRTLANPSNAKQGQAGCFRVDASGATRTLAKGSNYFSSDAVSWPLSIPSGSVAYIFYWVQSSSVIIITGVIGPTFN